MLFGENFRFSSENQGKIGFFRKLIRFAKFSPVAHLRSIIHLYITSETSSLKKLGRGPIFGAPKGVLNEKIFLRVVQNDFSGEAAENFGIYKEKIEIFSIFSLKIYQKLLKASKKPLKNSIRGAKRRENFLGYIPKGGFKRFFRPKGGF